MSSVQVPTSTKVLVIGGGPGGSYTASVLGREGIDVVLLEADKFPRYHVGESQLASLKHFLRFIDLEETFENHGFTKKVGAGFKLNQHKREGYTNFTAVHPNNYSWNVIRSQADELMFRHAAKSGAKTFEETKVVSIEFQGEGEEARPVSATWKSKSGETGQISFDYVVDASGRNGILSTKYIKNRKYNDTLLNVASWGYFRGTGQYMPESERANSPFFEALTDETGWVWFIPLHDGTTSIGVVQNQEEYKAKKARTKEAKGEVTTQSQFLEDLNLVPHIKKLMGPDAKLVKKDDVAIVSSASDYSYSASSYAGTNYRIVGDAGCFIDPFFSSGCHLAISGGLTAAATICAAIRGDCTEAQAVSWHTKRVETSYTRFLLVVLSAYHQMRAQNAPVLSTNNEDNFDRAFDHFRPIIQGISDAGAEKTPVELPKTIEFLAQHTFSSGVMTSEGGATDAELEAKKVAQRRAVRQLLQTDDNNIDGFISHIINGYHLRIDRGHLGLQKAMETEVQSM